MYHVSLRWFPECESETDHRRLFAGGGSLLFGLLSLVTTLLWLGVTLVAFGAWVYLTLRAYRGETVRIPGVSGFADRIA